MNLQFEERLKKEALRVKVESEKHHLEDKRVAIEHTRAQADTKLQEQKKKWEKQLADAQRQVPMCCGVIEFRPGGARMG